MQINYSEAGAINVFLWLLRRHMKEYLFLMLTNNSGNGELVAQSYDLSGASLLEYHAINRNCFLELLQKGINNFNAYKFFCNGAVMVIRETSFSVFISQVMVQLSNCSLILLKANTWHESSDVQVFWDPGELVLILMDLCFGLRASQN